MFKEQSNHINTVLDKLGFPIYSIEYDRISIERYCGTNCYDEIIADDNSISIDRMKISRITIDAKMSERYLFPDYKKYNDDYEIDAFLKELGISIDARFGMELYYPNKYEIARMIKVFKDYNLKELSSDNIRIIKNDGKEYDYGHEFDDLIVFDDIDHFKKGWILYKSSMKKSARK